MAVSKPKVHSSRLVEQQQKLNELLKEIKARRVQPEDRYEIAALLESMGWNDERAAKKYGVQDIFELAAQLWDISKSNIIFTPFHHVEKMGLLKALYLIVSNFLRGAIFALPMAVSVFSMISLKFSLWSYEDLELELATAIAIGTILSFITVGGFMQAIARRGFFYIMQDYYGMARKVTFQFITLGTFTCLAISAFIFFGNSLIQLFPYRMIFITILYYFFLNTIWLSVTVMYILKKDLVFTGLITIGIMIVYLLFVVFGIHIIVSQLISLLLVSSMSIGLVIYYFSKAEAKAEKGIEPKLPKMSVAIYNTMPYFIYGMLYFIFLFVDRVMAWSVDTAFLPYLIWFRGDYELGLDFSLLVLIIPMGIIEVVLFKLLTDIQQSQKNYLGQDIDKMNRRYIREYFIRGAFIFIVSMVSALLLYYYVGVFLNIFHPELRTVIYHNPVTHFVFVSSLVSYGFLSVGLMNAVTMFSLSQPHKVIKSIVPALLVNLLVGFVLSRWFGYKFAVVGLLIGSIVFVLLSSRQVFLVIRKLDYYMYSSS